LADSPCVAALALNEVEATSRRQAVSPTGELWGLTAVRARR
jgi:hypothetical protein